MANQKYVSYLLIGTFLFSGLGGIIYGILQKSLLDFAAGVFSLIIGTILLIIEWNSNTIFSENQNSSHFMSFYIIGVLLIAVPGLTLNLWGIGTIICSAFDLIEGNLATGNDVHPPKVTTFIFSALVGVAGIAGIIWYNFSSNIVDLILGISTISCAIIWVITAILFRGFSIQACTGKDLAGIYIYGLFSLSFCLVVVSFTHILFLIFTFIFYTATYIKMGEKSPAKI